MTKSDCRAATPEGTRGRIVAVARRLFSDRSYLGVSMSDIAAQLGISKAALYYHFSSKTEIYGNVLDDAVASLRACLRVALEEKTPYVRLRRLVREYLAFGVHERNLTNALVVKLPPSESELRRRIGRLREELADMVQPVVESVMSVRAPRLPADSRLVASVLTATMDGLLLEYAALEEAIDLDKASGQIMTVLGLQPEEPSPGNTCCT